MSTIKEIIMKAWDPNLVWGFRAREEAVTSQAEIPAAPTHPPHTHTLQCRSLSGNQEPTHFPGISSLYNFSLLPAQGFLRGLEGRKAVKFCCPFDGPLLCKEGTAGGVREPLRERAGVLGKRVGAAGRKEKRSPSRGRSSLHLFQSWSTCSIPR